MLISLFGSPSPKPKTWVLLVARDLLLRTTLQQSYAFPKEAINLQVYDEKTKLYQSGKYES